MKTATTFEKNTESMLFIFKNNFFLISCLVILYGCSKPDNNQVNVTLFSTNKSIESKVKIINEDAGKKYVLISLTNKGDKTDYLDSIHVLISPPKNVSNNTKIMFH